MQETGLRHFGGIPRCTSFGQQGSQQQQTQKVSLGNFYSAAQGLRDPENTQDNSPPTCLTPLYPV